MVIQEKIGNLSSFPIGQRTIDPLPVEWYETTKRILRKRTRGGREIALRFLNENPTLADGDILYTDEHIIVSIEILPCDAMIIPMASMESVASACYEIGNRHLPLFIESAALLAPYEDPLFRWLQANGYNPSRAERKLLRPLRSSVAAHAHDGGNSTSLLSKIIQLTNPRT